MVDVEPATCGPCGRLGSLEPVDVTYLTWLVGKSASKIKIMFSWIAYDICIELIGLTSICDIVFVDV